MKKPNATIVVTLPEFPVTDMLDLVVNRLADQLEDRVTKQLDTLIKQRFDEGVRKAADNAVADFLVKTLPITNIWGERTEGKTQTVTEYVIDQFGKHMQERVRADGTRGDYNDKLPTRHQWLIEQFGTKEIVKAAQAEIEKVRKTAEAQVSAAVGNFIAQNLVAPITAISMKP